MSRTVVRASAFLVAISLALAATRAFSDDPPKKPADDDPFGEHATPEPASPFDDEDAAPTKKPAKVVSSTAKPPAAKQVPSSGDKAKPKSKPATKLHGGEKAILKALKQKTSLEFGETPLKDVIDSIQKTHHIPIILDVAGLKDANVEPDTPVTIEVSGISLQSALGILLEQLGLKWTVHHDVLMITSPAKTESDEYMRTKLYDVSDLVLPVSNAAGIFNPLTEPNSVVSDPTAYRSGQLLESHTGPAPYRTPPVYMDRGSVGFIDPYLTVGSADFQPLMDLITNTIATKAWIDNGGNGTISEYPGQLCLVISQTQEVHREIEELLADLRSRQRTAFQIELQWLWLDAAHRDSLFASGGKRSANRRHTAIDRQRLSQIAGEAPSFHALANCLNGQKATAAVGDRRALIINAVAADKGGGAYQPIVSMPNVGVTASVVPILLPGTKTVRLTVQSRITRWTPARAGDHRRGVDAGQAC